jgi:hypothetical protein
LRALTKFIIDEGDVSLKNEFKIFIDYEFSLVLKL